MTATLKVLETFYNFSFPSIMSKGKTKNKLKLHKSEAAYCKEHNTKTALISTCVGLCERVRAGDTHCVHIVKSAARNQQRDALRRFSTGLNMLTPDTLYLLTETERSTSHARARTHHIGATRA